MTAPNRTAVVAGVSASSQSLQQVVALAAREAAAHDLPLCLLHAFNWGAALEAPTVAGSRAEAEQLMERAAGAARAAEPGLPVSSEIVEGGALDALIRRSETAYLVAIGDGGMANHGQRAPADAPAVQLAARAGCPVLVVRHEPPPQGPVLVGVDGSESSRVALDFAFDCAAGHSARLLAVRVTEPGKPLGEATDELAATVAECSRRHPSVPAECHVIGGDPGAVLVEQSRSAQLAVVGARGDEPWRGMLGAVSQGLVYHSPAPVIVVRGLISTPVDGA